MAAKAAASNVGRAEQEDVPHGERVGHPFWAAWRA